MKKLRYIIPTVVITEMNADAGMMATSLEDHAGGVSTKDRDLLDDEEAAAADAASQTNKYSLW